MYFYVITFLSILLSYVLVFDPDLIVVAALFAFDIHLYLREYIDSIWDSTMNIFSPRDFPNRIVNKMEISASARPSRDHIETRVVTIENQCGESQSTKHHRLKTDCILQFRIGASFFGKTFDIFANIPESDEPFVRNKYRKLDWSNVEGGDENSKTCALVLKHPGAFHCYVKSDLTCDEKLTWELYFVVEPTFRIGDFVLPLESLQCVTYLTRSLGPLVEWEDRLRVAKETGYNCVHLTPIQALGSSRSAYSIKDQLKLNASLGNGATMDEVKLLLQKIRKSWKVFSICDIVLNHTASDSEWLVDHPECAYNLSNSPYLKAAYLLDITLYKFGMEVAKGLWEHVGIPPIISNEDHLSTMRYILLHEVLKNLKIHELYTIDVESVVAEFMALCRQRSATVGTQHPSQSLKFITDEQYRRLKTTVDLEEAVSELNIYRNDCFDEESRLQKCASDFKLALDEYNSKMEDEMNAHLVAAVDNALAGVRYERVTIDGPKLVKIDDENPLFPRCFVDYNMEADEEIMYSDNARFIMACNGWIMNADPFKNFASREYSSCYLRRELIAWGDSIKLRYGDSYQDCPFLWERMEQYVKQIASMFDGVRIDNCHSTPLHVAEFMLDAARRVNPQLYVVAELFTGNDLTDSIFVNRLAITTCVRESFSAWDPHELGRLVYRFGGDPVGAFLKGKYRPLTGSIAAAMFYDITHDNENAIQKRSVFDLLPRSALVCIAHCATASTSGYDQLVPEKIDVVKETRVYESWEKQVTIETGILKAKKALNDLHTYLAINGFDEVFVDQIDHDVLCVTRHNSNTRETIILIAYASFGDPNPYASGRGKSVVVCGCFEEGLLTAHLRHRSGAPYQKYCEFVKDKDYINGLTEYVVDMQCNVPLDKLSCVNLLPINQNQTRVDLTEHFKPGYIVALKFKQCPQVLESLAHLSSYPDLSDVIKSLSLGDVNKIMFCCNQEDAPYDVPFFGAFVYCGLQGLVSVTDQIAENNDLGHPVCDNIRQGDWLITFLIDRLEKYRGCDLFRKCFADFAKPFYSLPHFLKPSYFERIAKYFYNEIKAHALAQMPRFITEGPELLKELAFASVQFCGIVESSPLPPFSSKLLNAPPEENGIPLCVSLSAGLPHFSVGYTRNWGRDTFISIRGLLLLTGRYEEARYLILAYGACLRHGLIPNLLDGGKNARYNCRDAVWWWIYSIKCYVTIVPNGSNILRDVVNRLYPTDDAPFSSIDQPLMDTIQEVMTTHFQGLCFRERNAGSKIDEHMASKGFDNQIGVNPETGFVFGGNEWNCGTWMDKMGSSDKAGNRGRPATPRDGSAIEIVALNYVAATWLSEMHKALYPYSGVTRTNGDGTKVTWSFAEWSAKIKMNFESHFWISAKDQSPLVNRREIYKDCLGATQPWADYQLRCNFIVAMVVAPDLFNPANARKALHTADALVGPLGMKTLDPTDWTYRGDYDADNDSTDPSVAHGFNYHNGPEWLWPKGYYIRAGLHFDGEASFRYLKHLNTLGKHSNDSPWKSLTELTNENGSYCKFSCPAQAWSVATIIEVFYDMYIGRNEQPISE